VIIKEQLNLSHPLKVKQRLRIRQINPFKMQYIYYYYVVKAGNTPEHTPKGRFRTPGVMRGAVG
jgi:hypothetical protein